MQTFEQLILRCKQGVFLTALTGLLALLSHVSQATAQPALKRITLSPASATIDTAQSQQFTVTGVFEDDSTQDLTDAAAYESDRPQVAVVSPAGLATGMDAGKAKITATYLGKKDDAELTVRGEPRLRRIALSPASATIVVGGVQEFTALGTFDDGSTVDLTTAALYSSSHQRVALAGIGGSATGVAAGQTHITATYQGKHDEAELTVTGEPKLDSVTLAPDNQTIGVAASLQFTATAHFKDGTSQDVTTLAVYKSSHQKTAVISPSGAATGVARGKTKISATYMGKKGDTHLTVTGESTPKDKTLDFLTINPAAATIQTGDTQPYTVTGTFKDGTTQDLTAAVSFSSSKQNVALVGTDGIATGISAGEAKIIASLGGKKAEATLNVTGESKLVSIAISPGESEVAVGRTIQFTVTATLKDGSTRDVTSAATYSSDRQHIALAGVGGTATGVSEGTARIKADYMGKKAEANIVVIPAPPFTGFAITSPANLSVFNTTSINVQGQTENDGDTVTVNGVAATVSGRNFTADIPIREGNNIITAVATGTNGVVSTASITVTRDTEAPRVTIDSPANGASFAQDRVTVTGIINDTVVGTVNGGQATVLVNALAAVVANRTYLATDIPLTPGTNVITATGTDRGGNTGSATIRVFYNTNITPRILLVSGNHQAGPIGDLLPQPLVVRVTDNAGNPCPDKKVIFKVCQNDGLVTGPTNTARSLIVMSGPDGFAQVQFRLGTRAGAGNHQVQANVVGFEGTAMFCASATPAAPGLLTLDAGNNQLGAVGQPLPSPFVTIVIDSGNNRLLNVPITYTVRQGGGSFGGASSRTINTDSDGRTLAVLTLGPDAGIENNVVEVTYPGNTGLPVTFVATGKVPGDPAETSITGVVLDNSDVPVPGATARILGTSITAVSDAQGQFLIRPAPVGVVHLLVDGSTVTRPGAWVDLPYDFVTVAGQENKLELPVRLLPKNLASSLRIDAVRGGLLALPEVPGFTLNIVPGSATFPDGSREGSVNVTVVHPDKIPHTPNFGQQPRFIISIQPAGTLFDPPAAMCIPNLDAMPPGQKTDMYSFDHDLNSFISIGTGTVTEDGMMVCSDPGVGIIKGGWHCGGNPAQGGSSASLKVEFSTPKYVVLKDQTLTVTALGSPPRDGEYIEWDIDDPMVAEFVGTPSRCSDQSSCTATIRGVGEGKTKVRVKFHCTTTGQSISTSADVIVPRPFQINVTTFIPYEFGEPGIPFGIYGEVTGRGDNRGFDPNATSYRTRQKVTVVTEEEAGTIIVGQPFSATGDSEMAAKDSLGIFSIDLGSCGNHFDSAVINPIRLNSSTIQVSISGSASTCAALGLAPAIDWCYDIVISNPPGEPATYVISGGNDNYPAYEVYINNQMIHSFSPSINFLPLLIGDCSDVTITPAKSGTINQ